METKHINDRHDPGAIEARALGAARGAEEEALTGGTPRIRLVEDAAEEAQDAVGEPASAPATAEATVDGRPARAKFVIHPLPGRLIPYWRRRR